MQRRIIRRFVCWRRNITSDNLSSDYSDYPLLTIGGRDVFVKRDDLVNVHGLNGNKGRKLYHLAKRKPFPDIVLSYGGARSNAMLAMAKLLSLHSHSKFVYITKKGLKSSYVGNFADALALGMQVCL